MIRADLNGFAVDLGGTKLAVAEVRAGEIVDRHQGRTDGTAPPEAQLEAMADELRAIGWQPGAPVGIAVAGRVGADGRWWAVNAATLSAIDGFDLRGAIARRFKRAVALNDAAAAGLAEARFGAGDGSPRCAFITVSTGVGGGLILDGRLIASPDGLAGHVGFLSSAFGDQPCGSGRRATVESVASGTAIAAAAARLGHEGLNARDVFKAAEDGAAWAEALIMRSAEAIARLGADLRALLGIDRLVIGGGVGLAPGYLARVMKALDQEPPLFRPEVSAAALGPDGGLLGALWLAMAEEGA
jgi:predicted NBD/HSP70 family sugar kinase